MLACFRRAFEASGSGGFAAVDKVAASLAIFGRDVRAASVGEFRVLQAALASQIRSPRATPSRRIAPLQFQSAASGACGFVYGNIDNRAELEQALGIRSASAGHFYAAAWDAWGEDLDNRLIGDYAAILILPDRSLRLARSAWRAPPLHFAHSADFTAVATTPRLLIAAGLPNRLNERKLVDNLVMNLREDEGWYQGCYRVDRGAAVHLMPDGSRRNAQFYDHLAQRETCLPNRQAYVEAADELLKRAGATCIRDYDRPGVFLSSGLDSSNVAARIAGMLPEGQKLMSFTWRPHPEFRDEDEPTYFFGDDWPVVQAFVDNFPNIEAHWAYSEHFDQDWDKLFLAMAQAPTGMCNMSLYGPVCEMARSQGCDILLDAELGNATFSDTGSWVCPDLLRRGEWKRLYRALHDPQSGGLRQLRQFLLKAVWPMVPDSVWNAVQAVRRRDLEPVPVKVSTARRSAIDEHDAIARARATNLMRARWTPTGRGEYLKEVFDRGEMQSGDINHAFEQVYGFRWRDVTSYRPFVEFCHGLPPEILVHEGKDRWLARELGKGLLPEIQRTRHRYGLHNCDWHEKMTPRRDELRAELRTVANDPVLSRILDMEKIESILDSWPDSVSIDDAFMVSHGLALPRAVMTKRFVQFVNGSNA